MVYLGFFSREMRFSNSQITDAGLVYLKRLTSLKVLDLGGAGITDANLQQLKQLVNLKELYLDDNQVTAAGVAELQKALPDCEISH